MVSLLMQKWSFLCGWLSYLIWFVIFTILIIVFFSCLFNTKCFLFLANYDSITVIKVILHSSSFYNLISFQFSDSRKVFMLSSLFDKFERVHYWWKKIMQEKQKKEKKRWKKNMQNRKKKWKDLWAWIVWKYIKIMLIKMYNEMFA